MSTGVVLVNFGEPANPTRDAVERYLTRIFLANADLETAESPVDRRERAAELAARRAPSLLEEYDAIGGSPLNAQTHAQARQLETTLIERGFDTTVYVGMQFTSPTIDDAVAEAAADGVTKLVGLSGYPLCGPSTTVQALDDLVVAAAAQDFEDPVETVADWHRHPRYNRLRAEAVLEYAVATDVDLRAADTQLLFSAHGTPQHYLNTGSRYEQYVTEYCAHQAALLQVDDYVLGFQNHANRNIPWTEPAVDTVVTDLAADRVVVEPVSFVHEQSETLGELDHDLRKVAEAAGLTFYRVPIPYDDPRLTDVLADVVEPLLAGTDPSYYHLGACQCRAGAVCLNTPTSEAG